MPTLEAQLTALTQEFVAKLVDALRNASFAEVAQLSAGHVASHPAPARPREARGPGRPPSVGKPGRQTAATRAELGERVVKALEAVAQPMGVRDLSSRLGVAPDVLAVPLR